MRKLKFIKPEFSAIYFLKSKKLPMFKIGVAKYLPDRIAQLEADWGTIDYKKSFWIMCINDYSFPLEKVIQKTYKNYQMINMDKNKTGHTEWFNIEIFSQVKADIYNFVKAYCHDLNNFGIHFEGNTQAIKSPKNYNEWHRALTILHDSYCKRNIDFVFSSVIAMDDLQRKI